MSCNKDSFLQNFRLVVNIHFVLKKLKLVNSLNKVSENTFYMIDSIETLSYWNSSVGSSFLVGKLDWVPYFKTERVAILQDRAIFSDKGNSG